MIRAHKGARVHLASMVTQFVAILRLDPRECLMSSQLISDRVVTHMVTTQA